MSEWKLVRLGDITDWFSGGTPSKQNENFWNGSIPWISAKTLKSTRISDSDINITKEGLAEGSKIAKKDDLLILVRGSGLFNSISIAIVEKEVAFNQDIKAIRIKDNYKNITPWFLLYWFHSNTRILYSILEETGIGAGKFDLKLLQDLIIEIPSKDEVENITKMIKSLDDKIILLHQQNKTLEELAQLLFKRWFVDFEFPDKDGKPYKSNGGKMVESELGEIPEGWEVKPLINYLKVINGYSYKGVELLESNEALVTLKNFDRTGGFRMDGFKELKSESYKERHIVNVGDLIVAHTDLTQDAEVLGNPAIIMDNEKYDRLIISMDMVKVESKNKKLTTEFIYYLMKDRRFKLHCKGYSNGTTVLHLAKNAIPEYLFAFPNDLQKVMEFGSYAKTTYSKISKNNKEIQTLTQLRDTLLPKLMSGEVRVKK